jgi:hypothetical protein
MHLVLSALEWVTLPHPVHKTRQKGSIRMEDAVNCAAMFRTWREIARCEKTVRIAIFFWMSVVSDQLAKTSELTKANAHKVMGVAQEARADEDDFHVFKRRKAEVEREEKIIAKVAGLVPRPDAHGPSKKGVKRVVYF